MQQKTVYLGTSPKQIDQTAVAGEYVSLNNESFYKISNYHNMTPFFISVVSDSDHWIYISSQGGLTAGRIDAENALFPYYTDDKISDNSEFTGSKTIALVTKNGVTSLWEPFSDKFSGVYSITRNLYKNVYGDKIVFEEVNADLGLTFQYSLMTSDKFGFIKTSKIINDNDIPVTIDIVDGLENLLPFGAKQSLQNEKSCLVDAYKKNELVSEVGLGLYTLSSILVDRAEPSEALSATTVWCHGLTGSKVLLSSVQLERFRNGLPVEQELDILGRRGAYLANAEFELPASSDKLWQIIAELNQGPAEVKNLISYIKKNDNVKNDIFTDIALGTENLVRIVANADGLQISQDVLTTNHHFSNVLFNVMRGGIFDNNYMIHKNDLISFIKGLNLRAYEKLSSFFSDFKEEIHYSKLIKAATETGDANLQRFCYEYLPITFSRRHGDPSRPWNKFSIELKNLDGSKLLNYQGNWRDIFQNWEALSFSIPNFVESMICKFVNATTADGYNPYRITKKGIDWEILDPEDPWSNIGYWGDHQVIYLLKFLEFSKNYYPGTLKEFLTKDIFAYANVPYSIKPYQDLLKDPHDTIEYDKHREAVINQRVESVGADGKLIWDKSGNVYHVNLTEKLLATVLSKLSNFIPEAGIWMNTQCPEWNDANNALVGYGVSMVTLYYTRRYQQYMVDLFSTLDINEIKISKEIQTLLSDIETTFIDNKYLLSGNINDVERKAILDRLGAAGETFRTGIYKDGFSGEFVLVKTSDLIAFFELSLTFIDHTINANKRDDGLYHSYNLMTATDNSIQVNYLYEMLEGQVSLLSSGFLSPTQAIEVLSSLRNSDIYTERQHTYLLYPNRQLARFVEKNNISNELVEKSQLLQQLVADENTDLVVQDINGDYHFNGNFNNVDNVVEVLNQFRGTGYQQLVNDEFDLITDIFEQTFNHKAFTGRSGAMYAFEGLGCVYWHMVSKLLLAVQENYQNAITINAEQSVIEQLADFYFDIRKGIGFNKTPDNYGAFPTDPYSHTPDFAGARQPGMTGQVKEEIITRQGELGLSVANGVISFEPILLKESEFLKHGKIFNYFLLDGSKADVLLEQGQLAFTYCQVPVVYSLADSTTIVITYQDGATKVINDNKVDSETSLQIFNKTGDVVKLEVSLKPKLQ